MSTNYDIRNIKGLEVEDALRILKTEGPNELPSAKPRSIFAITAEVVKEPMLLLLVGGGVIYLLLGDLREALLLLAFVFVVIGITLHQERKTENALLALRNLSSPRAKVIRGGQQLYIPGREVVRGDSIIISEGDRIPADGVIVGCLNLSVDESLLTGESVPVNKSIWDGAAVSEMPGGDNEPFVYSGTLVVQGQGVMKVQKTGIYTQMGKIGHSLRNLDVEKTRIETQTDAMVKDLALAGIALSTIVVILYGITRGDWLHGLLGGIALAMALLPEEFPVVLTIFLALGAWRMSKFNVLARRMPSVETLGSTTVLCVDKTGTLTENRMSVGALDNVESFLMVDSQNEEKLPESFHTLVEFSVLASQRDPFDPMEKAFHAFGSVKLAQTEHIHGDWILLQEYPLSRELLAMSHVWKSPTESKYVVAAKGAPEAISDLCHLNRQQRDKMSQHISRMANEGLRVIGMARAYFTKDSDLPDIQHDFDFKFIGLMGLLDPVRQMVPEAVQECHTAGIRTVMITGDYPATARNIAAQIGINNPGNIISGDELSLMGDDELISRISNVNVFARVVPEQKLRLVQAFKANGEVVAMTGDGVNDAPALKAADIGVAMGGRGTDVAREAAGLVLIDDDFTSIVTAVRMGRRVFDNLRKAMSYILAVHIPIAGLSLIPILLHWPMILMPVHIVFMELIIDPACSTVFEAERGEENIMRRPPRDPKESIFNRKSLILSLLQGTSLLIVCLLVMLFAGVFGLDSKESRTMAFVTLIVGNLVLILSNVSWSHSIIVTLRSKNKAMWWVVGGAFTFLALVLYMPFLSRLFNFHQLSLVDLAICIIAGICSTVWFEIVKLIDRKYARIKLT